MENIREIRCESCDAVALEFDNNKTTAGALEGSISPCQGCATLGRVSYDDENGQVKFIPLQDVEAILVDFVMLHEAYVKSQKRISELYDVIARLKNERH